MIGAIKRKGDAEQDVTALCAVDLGRFEEIRGKALEPGQQNQEHGMVSTARRP